MFHVRTFAIGKQLYLSSLYYADHLQAKGTKKYLHPFAERGSNSCPWKDAPLLAVWATMQDETLCEKVSKSLREGKKPDDPLCSMAEWIVIQRDPNLVNLLLLVFEPPSAEPLTDV